MARVLVSESDPGVRSLLQTVLRRGGHEAVPLPSRPGVEIPEGDLLVAEPGYGSGLRHATAFRERDGSLPIVFVSILPPERRFLKLAPSAYIIKPFPIAELDEAVAVALTSTSDAARRPGRPYRAARGSARSRAG